MLIRDFPNPRLNLPKRLITFLENNPERKGSFNTIDNYLFLIKDYIYTDIDHKYGDSETKLTSSFILRFVSSTLLRSLYVRNQFVDAINTRNYVSIYLLLKALLEITGALASVLELLHEGLTNEKLKEKLKPYILGNRGSEQVGTVEAKNVLTMIKNADKYLSKISNQDSVNFFSYFYDEVNNPSHPSYDSLELVSNNLLEGIWSASTPEEVKNKIITNLDQYGGLLMSTEFIEHICKEIFNLKERDFKELRCKKYFD